MSTMLHVVSFQALNMCVNITFIIDGLQECQIQYHEVSHPTGHPTWHDLLLLETYYETNKKKIKVNQSNAHS